MSSSQAAELHSFCFFPNKLICWLATWFIAGLCVSWGKFGGFPGLVSHGTFLGNLAAGLLLGFPALCRLAGWQHPGIGFGISSVWSHTIQLLGGVNPYQKRVKPQVKVENIHSPPQEGLSPD